MQTTNVAEAKTHLSMLVEKALAGEEVVISKHGKPIIRLVPYMEDTSPRDMSVRIWQGEVNIADDFDDLPPALLDIFNGDDDESAA